MPQIWAYSAQKPVSVSKKNLKNVGFLLDKSKVAFNIIKDGLRFFKIILCKDS